jgi:hypothetical protein
MSLCASLADPQQHSETALDLKTLSAMKYLGFFVKVRDTIDLLEVKGNTHFPPCFVTKGLPLFLDLAY